MKKTGRNEYKYVKTEQCNQPCSMKHEINKKKIIHGVYLCLRMNFTKTLHIDTLYEKHIPAGNQFVLLQHRGTTPPHHAHKSFFGQALLCYKQIQKSKDFEQVIVSRQFISIMCNYNICIFYNIYNIYNTIYHINHMIIQYNTIYIYILNIYIYIKYIYIYIYIHFLVLAISTSKMGQSEYDI